MYHTGNQNNEGPSDSLLPSGRKRSQKKLRSKCMAKCCRRRFSDQSAWTGERRAIEEADLPVAERFDHLPTRCSANTDSFLGVLDSC